MKNIVGSMALATSLLVTSPSQANGENKKISEVQGFFANTTVEVLKTPPQKVSVKVPFTKAKVAGNDAGKILKIDTGALEGTLKSHIDEVQRKMTALEGTPVGSADNKVVVTGKIVGNADPVGNVKVSKGKKGKIVIEDVKGGFFRGHIHGNNSDNKKTALERGDEGFSALVSLLERKFGVKVESSGISKEGKVIAFSNEESGEIVELGKLVSDELGIDPTKMSANEIEAMIFSMINNGQHEIKNKRSLEIVSKIGKRLNEMHIAHFDVEISVSQKVVTQKANVGNIAGLLIGLSLLAFISGLAMRRKNVNRR